MAISAISAFKFCVTQIKLKAPDNSPIKVEGADAIEARLGLVDLSAAAATSWGSINVPTGFQLGELDVELHADAQACSGATYSVHFENGTNTTHDLTKDVEFRFRFNPAITIHGNDIVSLGLTNIVSALNAAADNNAFDDDHISSYLTPEIEGDGLEEEN